MNMKKITKYIIASICPLLLTTACTKPYGDNMGVDNADDYSMVYTVNARVDSIVKGMVIPMGVDTVYQVYANFGGIDYPKQDLSIKFKVMPELADTYNEENGTDYPVVPTEGYSIENDEAIIKKGELLSAPVRINISSKALDGVGKFLLPIQLESVTPETKINEDLRTIYLQVNGFYESNPFQLVDRALWSVAGFSTDEIEANEGYPSNNGRAACAIDGSNDSFWCTQWRDAKPGPPHWIAFDMGQKEELHGLLLRGRNAKLGSTEVKSDGNPRLFSVEVSNDNTNWEAAGKYEVTNLLENTVYFDHKKNCRYFRVTVTASQNDFYGTHLCEVNAF